MLLFKRFSVLLLTAVLSVSAAAQSNTGREMSVEESYLQETIEVMLIREFSRSDSMDQKLLALEYIGDAIKRGNTGVDVRQSLEFLSLEGTRNVARESGRVMNNFPHVRREAAKFLGQIGTEEAKNALLNIVQSETEPMVLTEAIKSLGDIGLNKNEETVITITRAVSRFDSLAPDNLIALSTIDAFERIAKKNNGIRDVSAVRLLYRITEGPYIKPVQELAKQVIADLRNYK